MEPLISCAEYDENGQMIKKTTYNWKGQIADIQMKVRVAVRKMKITHMNMIQQERKRVQQNTGKMDWCRNFWSMDQREI